MLGKKSKATILSRPSYRYLHFDRNRVAGHAAHHRHQRDDQTRRKRRTLHHPRNHHATQKRKHRVAPELQPMLHPVRILPQRLQPVPHHIDRAHEKIKTNPRISPVHPRRKFTTANRRPTQRLIRTYRPLLILVDILSNDGFIARGRSLHAPNPVPLIREWV